MIRKHVSHSVLNRNQQEKRDNKKNALASPGDRTYKDRVLLLMRFYVFYLLRFIYFYLLVFIAIIIFMIIIASV